MFLQGYLAHKKTPTPLAAPQDPFHRPTCRVLGDCAFLSSEVPPYGVCYRAVSGLST